MQAPHEIAFEQWFTRNFDGHHMPLADFIEQGQINQAARQIHLADQWAEPPRMWLDPPARQPVAHTLTGTVLMYGTLIALVAFGMLMGLVIWG